MQPDIETRKFALELAVRLAAHGSWVDIHHRARGATDAAEVFVSFIDGQPEPPARAPTAAAKVA